MKRVLITGAAGFIGAHLINSLKTNSSYELLALDVFSDFYSPDYKHLRVNFVTGMKRDEVIQIDISNRSLLEKVFSDFQPNTVINLAAQAGVRLPLDQFHLYTQSNLVGFSNIMALSAKYKVQEVLYASSSSVYGDFAQAPFKESERNLKPSSFYGATKLSNEVIAQSFARNFGMKVRGLRFFTVYGPWGRPDMAYFRMLASLLHEKEFQLYGDGSIMRDFTFIDDVTHLINLLLENLKFQEHGFHDVVNVGGGSPKSINQVMSTMEMLAGRKMKVKKYSPELSDVRLTHSEVCYRESLIGKHSFVGIESGLEKFHSWGTSADIYDKMWNWTKAKNQS